MVNNEFHREGDLSIAELPSCFWCKNLKTEDIAKGKRVCAAFPEGIPAKIWAGFHSHQNSFPGDNGIRYEKIAS